ncbi:hypothetical protein [Caldalkalibacillus mannanilyticus]|uniref:hypothetical protein n=1 Tax=Caldalkalibacillus mannanilyticus TaxID=1418 RepID=UPI000469A096|nr:hypothetical protein [Caldalkalibacillus mannanilyticus]
MQIEYYSLHANLGSFTGKSRIISLMPHITDHLISLNIQPVGTVTVDDNEVEFQKYLRPYLPQSIGLGRARHPNIGKINDLQPDIIIGEAKKHLCFIDSLSAIAPTILFKDLTVDWKSVLMFLASLFDRQLLANSQLKEFYLKIEGYRNQLKNLPGKNIVLSNMWKNNIYRIYTPHSHLGKLLYKDLGLPVEGISIFKGTNKPLITMGINEVLHSAIDDFFILTEDTLDKRVNLTDFIDEEKGDYAPRIHSFIGLKDGVEGKGLILYNLILTQLIETILQNSKEVQRIV